MCVGWTLEDREAFSQAAQGTQEPLQEGAWYQEGQGFDRQEISAASSHNPLINTLTLKLAPGFVLSSFDCHGTKTCNSDRNPILVLSLGVAVRLQQVAVWWKHWRPNTKPRRTVLGCISAADDELAHASALFHRSRHSIQRCPVGLRKTEATYAVPEPFQALSATR